jgi:hypothetical protein
VGVVRVVMRALRPRRVQWATVSHEAFAQQARADHFRWGARQA